MSAAEAQHPPSSNRKRPSCAERVSHALNHIPRGLFLGPPGSHPAGAPDPIPPEPVLRRMLEALDLTGCERVLELGSSTGYQVALLSLLVAEVVSVVPDAAVAAERGRLLMPFGCQNVQVVVGRETNGWPDGAPYAAVLVDAGITHIPARLLDQLELGGRLIAPLGDASGQLIELVHHAADGFVSETRGYCHLPMLPSASRRPSSFPWRKE